MDVGHTKWGTCYGSTSYTGIQLDVLKSALQKYLRRRCEDKMLWCLREIYLFKVLASEPNQLKASKAIISNLCNRLIIMLDEELLFADWKVHLKCKDWLAQFEDGQRADFMPLFKVCRAMVRGRILRLNSDIRGHWYRAVISGSNPRPISMAHDADLRILHSCFQDDDHTFLEAHRSKLEAFASALQASSPSCYYWAHLLFNTSAKAAKRYSRRDGIYILWEYLFKIADHDHNRNLHASILSRLHDFKTKKCSERHMWLSAIVSCVLHRHSIDWEGDHTAFDVPAEPEEIQALFRKPRIHIDDYAIDQHTRQGRLKKGRDRVAFCRSGALVRHQDTQFYVPAWRSATGRAAQALFDSH